MVFYWDFYNPYRNAPISPQPQQILDLAWGSLTTSVSLTLACIMLTLRAIFTPSDNWNPASYCIALLMASSRFLGSVLLHRTLSVIAVLFILAKKWVHREGSIFSFGASPVTILCALVYLYTYKCSDSSSPWVIFSR